MNGLSLTPVAVVSHERSGTHLTIDNILAFFENVGKNNWRGMAFHRDYAYCELDQILWKGENFLKKYIARTTRQNHTPLLKSHIPREGYGSKWNENLIFDILNKSNIVYVVRDGRDVLCSYYRYVVHFDNYRKSLVSF